MDENQRASERLRGLSAAPPKRPKKPDREVVVEPPMEQAVGISIDELGDILTLNAVKNFGPQKFKALFNEGLTPRDVLNDPTRLPVTGKRGDQIRRELSGLIVKTGSLYRPRAKRQIYAAHKAGARIVTYWHQAYPKNVLKSNYPVPLMYVRGSLSALGDRRAVACVGSRHIRSPYLELHNRFSEIAAELGFAIVSGFALGADSIGHEAAWRVRERTICVLPGSLERPFPPENKPLWERLLTYEGAAMVSEAPFGTRASSLLLRKRNKLIVAFALGVLVSQTAAGGGAMNAYRFAAEQRKPIATFADDGAKDTMGNQVIAEDEKNQVSVLPSDPSSQEIWRQWLLKLSSST